MKVINLISGPRNLSTTIMYSFAQYENMTVLDEPFYGYYLKNYSLEISHPSHSEILKTMELLEGKVIQNINLHSKKSNIFVKGIAHHYLSENLSLS